MIMSTAQQITDRFAAIQKNLNRVNAEKSALEKELRVVKAEFLQWCEEQGTDKAVSDDITITRVTKPAVSIDGRWDDYVRWCIERGNLDLITHKRPNAKALTEMIEAGEVIPPWIEITEYDEATYRFRKGQQ
jgi:hypothetical protein